MAVLHSYTLINTFSIILFFGFRLCNNKQSKVYLPEPPFPHAEVSQVKIFPNLKCCCQFSYRANTVPVVQLIQTNKLKHYPSIHGDFSSEFRQPCVVFTGHPSLRFGDVVHFMELWGKSSLNTIIFTGTSSRSSAGALYNSPTSRHVSFFLTPEPDFSYLDALAPYQPLAMKCVYCPIDTRLNFHQVSKLLKEVQVGPRVLLVSIQLCCCLRSDVCCLLQPLHVVCPEQYTQPPLSQSHRSDLMLELQPPPMPYRRCSVLNLPFRRRYERVYILPEVKRRAAILK